MDESPESLERFVAPSVRDRAWRRPLLYGGGLRYWARDDKPLSVWLDDEVVSTIHDLETGRAQLGVDILWVERVVTRMIVSFDKPARSGGVVDEDQ